MAHASCRSTAAWSRSRSGVQRHVALKSYDSIDVDHLDGDGTVKAPMHGKVLAIFVEPGATVTKGERVAMVEAMKMEHALLAPLDGTVSEVAATVGAQVAEGAKILTIAPRCGIGRVGSARSSAAISLRESWRLPTA